jgi:hypothetical protein
MSLQQYTGSLRGLTFGVGEDYLWGEEAPAGLGIPSPETDDVASAGEGSFGGLDRIRNRIIRVPMIVLTGPETIQSDLDDLKRAWRPSSATVELDLRLGGDARRYYGRARGLDIDITRVEQGYITAVGTFDALDPFGYATSAQAFTADSSSPIVLTNDGTAPTRRATLTIVGNGGRPELVNAADPHAGTIKFRVNLAAGQTVTVNLNNLTIKNSSGAHVENMLSVYSTFFLIEVGQNTIHFTNCASVSAAVRHAYY